MDFWKTVGRSVVAPSERDQNWIGSSFRGESDKGNGERDQIENLEAVG